MTLLKQTKLFQFVLLIASICCANQKSDLPTEILKNPSHYKTIVRKPIGNFLGEEATLDFKISDSGKISEENLPDVHALLSKRNGKLIYLNKFEFEGGPAEITDCFIFESEKVSKNLFIIAKGQELHKGLGIDGYTYRVKVFKEQSSIKNGYPTLFENDSLEKIFVEGFEGQSEGGFETVYDFKNQNGILRRLTENTDSLTLIDQNCYKKVAISIREKNPDLTCAEKIANQFSERANPITQKNVSVYNDLGFFLSEKGYYKEAVTILQRLVNTIPSRTVAYLNLSDSYWNLGKKTEAQLFYEKYRDFMTSDGKEKKIPKRAIERIAAP